MALLARDAWAQSETTPGEPPPPTSPSAPMVPADEAAAPPGSLGAAPAAGAPSAPARGPDDRRQPPDYDGRPEPTTAGDVALWVPRVVLFPLYVVSE